MAQPFRPPLRSRSYRATVTPMSLPYRSGATFGLAVGVICAGASYVAAGTPASPGLSAWLQLAAIAMLVYSTLALAVADRAAVWGRRIATACLVVGFAAALLIPATAPRFLGVPLGTVLMMTLVGFVPLVVLPLLFAHGFQSAPRDVRVDGTRRPDQTPPSQGTQDPTAHPTRTPRQK